MVTDAQVRRLMKLMQKEDTLALAAAKAGMDEKPARKYRRSGQLPSQLKRRHTWRNRPDAPHRLAGAAFPETLSSLDRSKPVLHTALVIVRRLGYVNDRLSHGHLDESAQSPTTVFCEIFERVPPQQIRCGRMAGQQLVHLAVVQGDLLLPLKPRHVTGRCIAAYLAVRLVGDGRLV